MKEMAKRGKSLKENLKQVLQEENIVIITNNNEAT